MEKSGARPRLSVIIVSYNVSGYLDHCLDSVQMACEGLSAEIIVVDNASTDDSAEMVRRKYPGVILVENARNAGYSRANNQGIRAAAGEYVLLLNPDTLVPANAFRDSIAFLEAHPDAGMMSLKLVNADGSFQPACRRSFPTPATAFYRMTGLSRLFPQSRTFGRYNLTYLDEDQTAEVDALCGAYMMIRSEVLRAVGGLDETFFMFGEDIDFCLRIKQAGWKVCYHPCCGVIHFKGKSSRKNRFQSAWSFYNSMVIFSRKYFGQKLGFFPKGLLFLGIFLNALLKILGGWAARALPALIDTALINGTLFAALTVKFSNEFNFYQTTESRWVLLLHASISLIFTSVLAVTGVYSEKGKTWPGYLKALFVASLLFFSFVYFIPEIRFSRLVFTVTCLAQFILIPLWRRLASLFFLNMNSGLARTHRTVIIGAGAMGRRVAEKTFPAGGKNPGFLGFVRIPQEKEAVDPGRVLGEAGEIQRLVHEKRVSEIILATPEKERLDYMGLIQFCTRKGIILRLVQGMHDEDKYCILNVTLSESTVI